MRTAVIIPARYGSKRIPHKNFRPFLGRPILYRVLDQLIDAACFEGIFVNSDAPAAHLSELPKGAELIAREASLADDHTPIKDVVQNSIQQLEASGRHFDLYALVYATAVLVPANYYAQAHQQALQLDGHYLLSVTDYGHPIQRAFELAPDGHLQPAGNFSSKQRTQDFSQFYHDAAAFCFGARDLWFADAPIIGPATVGFKLPRTSAWDIDTQEDWEICEAIFARQMAR
jgi:pseudaminic acid cytidylyltransferase